MIRLLLAAAAAAPLALVAPAGPAVAQERAPSAAAKADADALVRLIFPPQIIEMQMPVAHRAFVAGIAADPNAREITAAYPGLAEAAWQAVAPELRAAMIARQPRLWDQLSALYVARFTPAQIQSLRRFFASTTGQKMLATMYAQVDPDKMLRDVVSRPEHDVTAATADRVSADAKAKTIARVAATATPEDRLAYARLAAEVPMDRVQLASKEAQALTLAYVNQRDPALEAHIGGIVAEATRRYIATHKRGE